MNDPIGLAEHPRQSGPEAGAGVVITGIGLLSALGGSMAEFVAGLRSGACGLQEAPELGKHLLARPGQESGPRVVWAGRVGEFGAAAAIEAGRRRRMPRLGQMAIVAARQAMGLEPGRAAAASEVVTSHGAERIAVVLGTGLGALDMTVEFERSYLTAGAAAASPAVFPYTVMNTAAALVAMELGLLGANQTVNHRDLTFFESLATAAELVVCGRADAVLAGACDELGPWLLHGLDRLGALAWSDAPEAAVGSAMRPYDRRRCGFAAGEGAAMVLIERSDAAMRRGAKVLARIAGIGRGGDDRPRVGWLRPGEEPQTAGAAAAVTEALAQAGLGPDQIDYVAGGGNGTDLDRLETAALRRSLGAAAEKVPISSVLGQTGEWLTSGGARLGAALFALGEQQLPGTALCEEPDPEASLPGLVQKVRPAAVRNVLLPCFAQGGGNVALVLSRE